MGNNTPCAHWMTFSNSVRHFNWTMSIYQNGTRSSLFLLQKSFILVPHLTRQINSPRGWNPPTLAAHRQEPQTTNITPLRGMKLPNCIIRYATDLSRLWVALYTTISQPLLDMPHDIPGWEKNWFTATMEWNDDSDLPLGPRQPRYLVKVLPCTWNSVQGSRLL